MRKKTKSSPQGKPEIGYIREGLQQVCDCAGLSEASRGGETRALSLILLQAAHERSQTGNPH